MTIYEATKQGEIKIKKRMRCIATGWPGEWVREIGGNHSGLLELMITSIKRPGISVVECPACTREVPGISPV